MRTSKLHRLKRTAAMLCVVGMATAFGGCVSVLSMGLPQSKYAPLLTSESVLDRFLSDVRAADGQVVSDPLGSYFHRTVDGRIEAFNIADLDKDALKGLLATDVGLLEPLVSYRPNGQPFIDWAATERRRSFLVKTLRLNILPLASSRRYHDQVLKFAAYERTRLSNSMTAVRAAFKGGDSLYNEHFYNQVVAPMAPDFQYLVADPLYAVHFGEMKNGSIGVNESMVLQMGNSSRMNFVPRRYLQNLQAAGSVRHFSGCGVLDVAQLTQAVRAGFSPPTSGPPLQERYVAVAAGLDGSRQRVEASCVEGLRAMALSGAIRSQALQ